MKTSLIIIGIVLFIIHFFANNYYANHATLLDVLEREMYYQSGLIGSSFINYLPIISLVSFYLGLFFFFYGLLVQNQKYKNQ